MTDIPSTTPLLTENPSQDPNADGNATENDSGRDGTVELGEKLFQWRDYTPIPLIFILLFVAEPRVGSATIGTLIILLGEAIRIYSVAFIGTVSRTRSESTGGQVVNEGPYSLVRNPLYVGNFFIVFGILVYAAVAWFAVLAVAAFAFQYYHIVRYEEWNLTQRFGESYKRYCEGVPAWIPKRMPKMDDFPMPDSYLPALRSERRTLTAIAAVLFCLMLTA